MDLWICCLLISVVIFILFCVGLQKNFSDTMLKGLFALWIVSLTMAFCFWDAVNEQDKKNSQEQVEETIIESRELVAVSDGSAIGGSIFAIDEAGIYRYYYKLEDGGFSQGEIKADSVVVYYIEDGSKPRLEHVERYTYKVRRSNGKTFDKDISLFWRLYIPENSIVENYTLDAQ